MKIDDILTYEFNMWILYWHISNYKWILFSNHLGNNITSMFYRVILYRCHFPRGEIFILTAISMDNIWGFLKMGRFPVVTMLVSETEPWSSMTTGWFGRIPWLWEPPWLVLWNIIYFSIQLGIIIPSDELIFFRGVETTNQMMYSGFLMLITIRSHWS